MRGVVVVVVVLFTLGIFQFIAAASVEPVGESLKPHIPGKYHSVIDSVYDVVFKWSTLIFGGGMMLYGLRWYIRKERFAGGGRRPP